MTPVSRAIDSIAAGHREHIRKTYPTVSAVMERQQRDRVIAELLNGRNEK